MKQGTTTTFKVKQFDLPDITEIIFSFTNDKNNVVVERTTPTTDDGQIHKSYPSEVSLEDGYYKIGLDQDETLKLNETFYVEAQIMFSGAVTKAYIDKVKMPHTFYTKVIDGATTNGEEIELTMELSDVIEINGSSTGDYTDLTNKPRINNIELIGNKTTSDLGLDIEVGDGLKREGNVVSVDLRTSYLNPSGLEFTDGKLGINGKALSNFKNLQQGLGYGNYFRQYLVDTNYNNALASKTYVDNLMSGAVKRLVVQTLPTQDIDTNTIYMVLKSVPTTNNIYDEYMYINNAWELIGSTEVNLSNYYTKSETYSQTEIDTALGNKQDTLTESDGIEINANNEISVKKNQPSGITNYISYYQGGVYIDTYSLSHDADFRESLSSDAYQFPLQPKLTAGTNITIDSNNVISASGGGLSYTFTDGLTESSGTVGIDLASGSKLLIDANDKLDVDLSSKQDVIDSNNMLDADLVDDSTSTNKFVTSQEKQGWDDKADDTVITTDTTSTTVSLTLADNNEYRYTTDLTSLTLTMPSGDFISSIVFASGSTPTSMTYDSSIKWSGDDVTSNAFVPQANMEYEIVFWYNGLSINAVVRGVA